MTTDWLDLWQGKWTRDDKSAGERYDSRGHRQVADHIAKLGYIMSCHSIVDVGCGTGHVLSCIKAAEKVGLDIYPLDKHPDRAEFFRAAGISYVQGVATDLSRFPDARFDFAIMHGVTQFLNDDELQIALREMERVSQFAVIVLDTVHRSKVDQHTALRKAMKDRETLPPQLSHRPEAFMDRGYTVANVGLELTIGWENKFDAWKVAVK